jgi:hypothetical protein
MALRIDGADELDLEASNPGVNIAQVAEKRHDRVRCARWRQIDSCHVLSQRGVCDPASLRHRVSHRGLNIRRPESDVLNALPMGVQETLCSICPSGCISSNVMPGTRPNAM